MHLPNAAGLQLLKVCTQTSSMSTAVAWKLRSNKTDFLFSSNSSLRPWGAGDADMGKETEILPHVFLARIR